ncbi:MAG: hypothetical protein ACKO9V_03320 [Candidatus Kapaibacterium sp.]
MTTALRTLRRICCSLFVVFAITAVSAQKIRTDSIPTSKGGLRASPGPKATPPAAEGTMLPDTADDDEPNGLRIDGGGASFKAGIKTPDISHPSIELSTGSATLACKDMIDVPQTMGVLHISTGTLTLTPLKRHPSIARADYDRVFVQLYDSEYRGPLDASKVWLNGWRFGFQLASGYSTVHTRRVQGPGWIDTREVREPGWSLLHTGGLMWSYNTFGNIATADSNVRLSGFYQNAETYRFGSNTGAMIRYDATPALSIHVAAERMMMYRDYSFWGWAGSALVEGLAQSIINGSVVRSIEKKSPESVAIADLLLRSALSYGIYEARRSGQHFPFSGNAPMIMDAIRLGLAVSF